MKDVFAKKLANPVQTPPTALGQLLFILSFAMLMAKEKIYLQEFILRFFFFLINHSVFIYHFDQKIS